jgi:hypothetical protein
MSEIPALHPSPAALAWSLFADSLIWCCRDLQDSLDESGARAEDGVDWGVLRVEAAVQDPYDTIVRILLRPEAVNPLPAWARDEL